MTFEECKEKYPLGSYVIVKHKEQENYSWFQVNDYVITISGPFLKQKHFPVGETLKTDLSVLVQKNMI